LFAGALLASASDLISSIASLISAIAWPVVAAIVLMRFGPQLGRFVSSRISHIDKLSLEAAGFRVSAEAATVELTSAAVEASRDEVDAPPIDVKEIAATVDRAARFAATRRSPEILWVDDRPENNVRERAAMANLGMHVTLSLSTDDALERLRRERFDVVISDMGRPPDPEAGYTLLEAMRSAGDTTPFVIYAGSNAPEHKQLARERGAVGSTNRPQELLDLVTQAIDARR
jgi:CheY-like chemotaxis protein